MSSDDRQERLDTFYVQRGPCCAGCDWWQHLNTLVGECHKAAPVSGHERTAMLGLTGSSLPLQAGHLMTRREHRCGDFADTFDWSSLPADYQRRIGLKPRPQPPAPRAPACPPSR